MNKSGKSLVKEARLFGNLQVLAITSLLVALSVTFGKLLAVNITQSFRISFGAACVGLVSGLVSHFWLTEKNQKSILVSVAAAHLLGSILVKSLGIYLWYGTPLSVLWLRIPIYLVTGTAEAYLILLLFQSRALDRYVKGVYRT